MQKQGGQAGPLAKADPERIGLWGHSMGGGISQRVLTVSDDVDAAVLYGAMSGDEALNHKRILYFTNGANGLWDVAPPDEALQRISPINYLDRVTAAVSIHHGRWTTRCRWPGRRTCAAGCRRSKSRLNASPTTVSRIRLSAKGTSSLCSACGNSLIGRSKGLEGEASVPTGLSELVQGRDGAWPDGLDKVEEVRYDHHVDAYACAAM